MDQSDRSSETSNRRLDSWTEIGAFFNRDEPTVRRWAKTKSLPVHRMPGQAGVYAFTDELSQWLKTPDFIEAWSEEPPPEGEVTETNDIPFHEDAPLPRKMPKSWALAAGAGLLLVLSVTGFLLFRFRGPSAKAGGSHGSSHPDAVEFYLKGREEWKKRTPESLKQAIDYYTQAIVHDPNYAEAYAGLADCYNLVREYTTTPDNVAFPRAMAAAKKAVELDDSLSDAHRALAFASFNWSWDFPGAEREFKRAIELSPNDPVSHHWYATSLLTLGRFPEALSEIDKARALEPDSPSIQADRAVILEAMHPGGEAVSILKQMEKSDQKFLSPHVYLAGIALDRHDYRMYIDESKKVAVLLDSKPASEIAKAAERGYASGGAKGLLENIRGVQEKYYAEGKVSGDDLARTCALQGRNAQAIGYLQSEFDRHDPRILGIRNDSAFNGLHGDPAFRALIARIGLPPI